MRKPAWILALTLMFLVINAQGKTLAQCKEKCEGTAKATCIKCCDRQDESARNRCSADLLKAWDKCATAAGSNEDKIAKCRSDWEKAAPACFDTSKPVEIEGNCAGSLKKKSK